MNNRRKHLGVIMGLIFLLLIPVMVTMPSQVSATTYYYGTNEASSYNSSYWKVYPRYSTGPVAMYAAQVREDPYTSDLYTSATYSYIQTNDFTNNGTWFQPSMPFIGGTQVDHMPPDNSTATIIKVYVCARVTNRFPSCYLSYSINDRSSWNTSSLIPEMTNSMYFWDVTSLETWNATILNSNQLWAQMKAYTISGIHYYMDYLGFSVMWSADYVVEGYGIPMEEEPEDPGETEEGGAQLDYDIIYSAEGIIGVLGFVGLIGMIAVPALGVWVYRQNRDEGRMSIFIKMLVLFMFCLTCFMVSVNGA